MSADIVIEEVPKFKKRVGDQVFQGSNNSIVIFGTDRAKNGPAGFADGLGHINAADGGKKTGTFHVIAGRAGEDPDFQKDKSFFYLTMKTNVDENLNIKNVESEDKEIAAAIVKSDVIRIISRKNLKICVNDDEKHYIFFDGNKLKVVYGNNTTVELVEKKLSLNIDNTKITMDGSNVKIDSPKVQLTGGCEKPWDDLFTSMNDAIFGHDHQTPVGPSTPADAGSSTTSLKVKVQQNKSTWDSKVKS